MSVALFDLVQHGLQPLFKLAPVLGPCHQRAHVQRKNRPIFEPLGHVAAHDPLRQAFDNRGLAHAGLADQHRIIFRLARQNADHAADFTIAPNHGIQLALARLGHEINAVFFQGFIRPFGMGTRHALIAAHLHQHGQKLVPRDVELLQNATRLRLLALVDEGQQEVLDRDVLVLQPARFLLGRQKQLLKTRRRVHFAVLNTGARHLGQPRQCVFDLRFEGLARHLHAREQAARQAIFLIDQTGEQMFPIHFPMPRAQRDLLRLLHGLARFFSQFVHGLHTPLRDGHSSRADCRAPASARTENCPA